MTEPFFAGSASGFPVWSGYPWGAQQQPFASITNPLVASGTGFGTSPISPGAPMTAAPFGVQTAPVPPFSGIAPLNYGVASSPYVPGPGFMPGSSAGFPGYGIPPQWAFGQAFSGFSGSPTFGGQELSTGVPPQALVSLIAMKRGQPMGPTNDREIEEVIYDALELLSGTNEVEARCEGGRVTLTGSVFNKRIKRDVGEVAWAIPSVTDVQNNVTITARRRARHDQREESQPATGGRKQA
jgi:hypothetical protein